MAEKPQVNQAPRPWNPEFTHADRERWICVYPAYINSKKTVKEGRRLPKKSCVDNPSYTEIRDVCLAASLVIGVENKTYCRELEHKDLKFRGRIRVQMKNEEGKPIYEKYQTRLDIMNYIAETIPKTKARQHSSSSTQSHSQQQGGKQQKKKKGRK